MKTCPRCERQCPVDAAFCSYCVRALDVSTGTPTSDRPGVPTSDQPGHLSVRVRGAVMTIGAAGTPIELADGALVHLGREADDPRVVEMLQRYSDTSRLHASLLIRGSHVEVRDRGSRHGTFVDCDGVLQPLTQGGAMALELPAMIRLAASCYVWVRPR